MNVQRKLAWPVLLLMLGACSSARDAVLELEQRKDERDVPAQLDRIATLRTEGASSLDTIEQCRAIALLVERADVDKSRIVRAKALETLGVLTPGLPGPRLTFLTRPVDEDALNRALDPLITFSIADEARRSEMRRQRKALADAAHALSEARPELLSLATRLLFLATRTARLLHDDPSAQELMLSGCALARHAAFLVGRKSLNDDVLDVRIAATCLIIGTDPVAATVELGKIKQRADREEVAMLEALCKSGLAAPAVHPTLRPELLGDLDHENAAVKSWSRQCLARLLGLDPELAAPKDLRARWLALGDWDAAAPRS